MNAALMTFLVGLVVGGFLTAWVLALVAVIRTTKGAAK